MNRYDALPSGHQLGGRYHVEALIGQGRSSAVYRAYDDQTDTTVALKILDPFLARDPIQVERFERELLIIRQLDHPNIVRLYSLFEEDGLHVLSMEHVAGLDAAAHLERNGPLAFAEFMPLAATVTAALANCHERGVLHRDLKPHNILLGPDGIVKLCDFGISKLNTMSDLTKTGTAIGTPQYMAPELFAAETPDIRSDVYSLGAVFYELLAGRPPHVRATLSAIVAQRLSAPVEPIASFRADVPDWLDAVIRKCLEVEPAARYQSCHELASELTAGERSLARYQQGRVADRCLSCRAELLRGLPLCHACGSVTAEIVQRGQHAIILYRCDDVEAVVAYLGAVFRRTDHARLRRRLRQPPVLVLSGVSRDTASVVAGDLAAHRCELTVTDQLPRSLRLPWTFAGLAFLGLCALIPLGGLQSVGIWVAGVVAVEVLLSAMYLYKTRPLLSFRNLGRGSREQHDEFSLEVTHCVRSLRSLDVKVIVGGIARGCLALRRRDLSSMQGAAVDPTAVARQGFAAAAWVDRYQIYLRERSLNDIKAKLDTATLRASRTTVPAELAPLIEAEASLAVELKRYRAIQDRHAQLRMALLNLGSLFHQLEVAMEGSPNRPAVGDLLARLERDLAERPIELLTAPGLPAQSPSGSGDLPA